MKLFMVRRILPLFLVISLLVPSFCVSASAVDFDSAYIDDGAVEAWNAKIHAPVPEMLQMMCEAVNCPVDPYDLFWTLIDRSLSRCGEVSFTDLYLLCDKMQRAFSYEFRGNIFGQLYDFSDTLRSWSICLLFGFSVPDFVVEEHPSSGLFRIKDANSELWLVDSHGRYPYYEGQSDPSDDPDVSVSGDHWRPANEVLRYLADLNSVDKPVRNEGGDYTDRGTLEAVKDQLVNKGSDASIKKIPGFDMEAINRPGYYWCNSEGQPYFCFPDDQVAVEQDRPLTEVTFEDGSSMFEFTEGTDVGIDMENMIVVLPDATIQPILDVTYNPSTFTYDVTTYDIDNYDITYNYTFEYHLQYTYVTYIGETDDFDGYKCYYKLPDGRNSADLTKEELEQLSVAIDVVEYSRATDDVRIRALYHFDGDTKDSSYWNHMSDFEWSNAPSISYMESDPFYGALYLDGSVTSTMHFDLPTDLGSGDFTIQFRYYQGQSSEEVESTGLYLNTSNVSDNEWLPVNDTKAVQLLNLTGIHLRPFEGSGERQENYPVGSWFEVCITRQGDVFTYYLNGQPLIVTDKYAGQYFSSRLTYHFVGGFSAYVMIDELRVLNFAIGSGEDSYYEPTAVPYDTNLALVIPEDKVALADEYWTFEHSGRDYLGEMGLGNWTTMAYDTSAYLAPFDSKFLWLSDSWVLQGAGFDVKGYIQNGPIAVYNSDFIKLNMSHAGTTLDLVYDQPEDLANLSYTAGYAVGDDFRLPAAAIYIPLSDGSTSWLNDGTYTFSVATGDGRITSKTFTITDGALEAGSVSLADGYYIGTVKLTGSYGFHTLFVGFNPATQSEPTQPILYMCLTKGSSSDLTAEFHESVSVVDKDAAFRPTLAVRTDLEVTDFQIGGVRPAIPSKGLVYALVESGYIRSLQIYNGQAWEGVDGRIWTGERWIPYGSYNVITLQDMYDIVDSTDNFEYIYTESGFWAWWQKSWNEFTGKLFSLFDGEKESLDQPIVILDPENEDDLSFWEFLLLVIDGGKSVVQGIRQLFSGVVSTVPDAVSTLTSAFEPGGMAVGLMDGSLSDPDSADSPILILRQPQDVTVESGQTATVSVIAHGYDLNYEWYAFRDRIENIVPQPDGSTNVIVLPAEWIKISSGSSCVVPSWGFDSVPVYCRITDDDGNVVESKRITVYWSEPSAVFGLRGFWDTDQTDYYETEVLDPWRYR